MPEEVLDLVQLSSCILAEIRLFVLQTLDLLLQTVIRIVMWNQSIQCSLDGWMYSCSWRTLSPPSERKTTCWFSAMPWDFSTSHSLRRGFSSNVWTKLKQLLAGRRAATPPHSCRQSLRRSRPCALPARSRHRCRPSGIGCRSQASSVPSKKTGFSFPSSASIRAAVSSRWFRMVTALP